MTGLVTLLALLAAMAVAPTQSSEHTWRSTRVVKPERYKERGDTIRDREPFLLRELDLKPGETIVDIGAGDGWWAERFAAAVGPSGRVYAAEIDQELVDTMKKTYADTPQIRPILSPTSKTGLGQDTCDVAIFIRVYHHLEEGTEVAYLQDLREVVKPDGRLVIIDHHPNVPPTNTSHILDPSDLFYQARRAGWVPVRYEQEIGGIHYIAVFVQRDLFEPKVQRK